MDCGETVTWALRAWTELGTVVLSEVRCREGKSVVWSVALAPQGVLSSEAVRELSPVFCQGGVQDLALRGNLLAEAAEQWP